MRSTSHANALRLSSPEIDETSYWRLYQHLPRFDDGTPGLDVVDTAFTVRSLIDLPVALGDDAMLSENPFNDRIFFNPAPELEGDSNDYLQLQ
jgi:hypothetical protein